ncbi:MAG TPA: hypothetical protein VGP20_00070, partial [Steroidobacteraceae bacterium]|nr:hypothetical protein [Steroidobacteraceae bacterium]
MVTRLAAAAAVAAVALSVSATRAQAAQAGRPWLDSRRSPDERAALALGAMTLEEKIALLHGPMPLDARTPPAAIPAA